MASFDSIVPKSLAVLHEERGHSPGVRVGRFLFISGMLGRNERLEVVTDPEAQISRVFENMEVVLHEVGCTWGEVAELTAYFTHLRRDFERFMTVRNRFIAKPYPAMTMIGVAELAHSDLICEVKGVAVIPEAASNLGGN